MTIDVSQFYEMFFEESLELISSIEKLLVEINVDNISENDINAIFRCAHSIKGGSGTFGFTEITKFTHIMENYLDRVRCGEGRLTTDSVDILLSSLDCVRTMIDDIKNNRPSDLEKTNHLSEKIKALMESSNTINPPVEAAAPKALDVAEENASLKKWKIYFKPFKTIFSSGNDPLKIICVLKNIGKVSSVAKFSELPSWQDFKPEICYLEWEILIETDKTEQEIIDHAFEWVVDESKIVIEEVKSEQHEEPSALKSVESQKIEANKQLSPKKKESEAASVRVGIEKIDALINMVGELVITQSMLSQIGNNFDASKVELLKQGMTQLEHNCRELQENVMRIRMLPISNVLNRFPRMIRDLSKAIGKKVELKMTGENTEIDKTVMEKIGDPLVHLIRNSLDHGIEPPEERIKIGKPEFGTLTLNAFHQGGNIVLEIIDDGRGLDRKRILQKAIEKNIVSPTEVLTDSQIDNLIFAPGFSTAEQVTDLSGRGVGMDVVKKNIDSLGGSVETRSEFGKGTSIIIYLPLTLAILDGQLIRIGLNNYVVPLISMIETIQIKKENISKISEKIEMYNLRHQYIPIIKLHELFDISMSQADLENQFLIIVELEKKLYGIVINELLQQQQVVIKSLENNYGKIEGISGATILGNGTVALILDIVGAIKLANKKFIDLSYGEIAA